MRERNSHGFCEDFEHKMVIFDGSWNKSKNTFVWFVPVIVTPLQIFLKYTALDSPRHSSIAIAIYRNRQVNVVKPLQRNLVTPA